MMDGSTIKSKEVRTSDFDNANGWAFSDPKFLLKSLTRYHNHQDDRKFRTSWKTSPLELENLTQIEKEHHFPNLQFSG